MSLADRSASLLLLVDFQERLMPAIAAGGERVAQAAKLVAAAGLLDVPIVYTEHNPTRIGPTVPALAPPEGARVVAKMTFDAWATDAVRAVVPADREIIVAGCEAHVCVLQTVLGLLADGRSVKVVRDAVGSRREDSRDAAIARMAAHGADVVTAEMVVFEWLRSAEHPRFREALALIK
ncbi:isochorismatase family protein [Enterovirga rhinocerotis]|uniref:Nicotinamidase-related amidase n=1 Tax=Enterovirga rhinocerotis TaxID=1339210 RepID=A0A4R7C588_9HYPH|nr:isochorismatase family protein [Enterovirga rhinocerotis]TDR93548.1 nicotinamidase-related amidase [Enterovirga rhinocerotis]